MQHTVNVFLAGDSTVQTYEPEHAPQAGWGQYIAEYFTKEVRFANRAIGGRSSKTFVEEGRLQTILEEIGKGDYLFVQMGHNDSTKSRPERYTEPFSTYTSYLKMYIDGARSRGAIPVLITPVGRLHYENGEFLNDFPDYCMAMKQLAAEENVLLADLMTESLAYYSSVGYEETKSFFMVSVNGTDHTHFTEIGARRMAKLLADQLKSLRILPRVYAAADTN
ncbi:rhamnogalacturonan acetylesterase [Paenibacillus agaridevorans]|uniref:Rhamnogalacturonan acetylesterase n=1 Tax=Paenibacillus agaridevorans TaxID=171404 RepID=A0A2R5EZ99_9BACL|nr:rhamnogalacturonan acetylesterase [Paenibacillus agaridevorans]GBG10408.1 rhamnogalacturonan acetylesterase [Paenibacillus agaridevorans]